MVSGNIGCFLNHHTIKESSTSPGCAELGGRYFLLPVLVYTGRGEKDV